MSRIDWGRIRNSADVAATNPPSITVATRNRISFPGRCPPMTSGNRPKPVVNAVIETGASLLNSTTFGRPKLSHTDAVPAVEIDSQ